MANNKSKKHNNEIYDYKPSNPKDPKIPDLFLESEDLANEESNHEFADFKTSTKTIDLSEKEIKKSYSLYDITATDNNEDYAKSKSDAKSLIDRIKNAQRESIENNQQEIIYENNPETGTSDFMNSQENSETTPTENKTVMPDPNSKDRLFSTYRIDQALPRSPFKDAKTRIEEASRNSRERISKQDIETIVNTFRHKVVKTTKYEVVLKNTKFGFEIYNNSSDGRWWVATVCFEEIWNPRKASFITFWTGNTFIGYGMPTLETVINKTHELMNNGRTGRVVWKDFVCDWDEKHNRLIASDTPKQFSWKEYQKIVKWWETNKIFILVKQKDVKDYEDIMNEVKEKKQRGERVNPLISLQSKLVDPPRRAQHLYGYPVENPDYKGMDYLNPENKLYEIGFTFTSE
ncbi:hypothetical protein SHELI_v1c07340 [Spiroplasma helicoides]|uniref:Uncharacterized protein n=1 Tax=Spiroplasma helicoides TaxID=216938 RepID=A0A1B3SL85_9MOLU|nr:hypothetical protein [Spiroplasma helicoides]AOG60683.1 hypothetical protein SHELI_v1c07340 [Spiroplasma helicoides]